MDAGLRILLMLDNMELGGAQLDVLNLANTLSTSGHFVVVVSRGGQLVGSLGPAVKHVRVETRSLPQAVRGLLRLIREYDISVVNTQSIRTTLAAGLALRWLRAGGRARRPAHVATIHNIHDRRTDRLSAHVLNRLLHHCIHVSFFEMRRLENIGLHTGGHTVIYSGFNLGEIAQAEPAQLGLNRPVVTCIARLSEEKGIDIFIRAAEKVLQNNGECNFCIVGEGDRREEYQQLVRDRDLQRHVLFLGYRQDVYSLLKASQVLVLSSRREALPRSIREAMLARVPVVASAVGGVPELIRQGETGLLFASEDADGLASGILTLLQDPELRDTLIQQAYLFAVRNFREEVWIDRTLAYFRQALMPGAP